MIPTSALRPGIEISSGTQLSLEDHQDISDEVIGDPHAVLKGPDSLTAMLKALLPNTAGVSQVEQQLTSSPDSYRSHTTVPRLWRLLLFAITNNFAGLDRLPTVEVVEYLKRQANTRLLQHVLSIPGPGSEAFAENLFSAAIELEDARTVEVLLQKRLNPNDLICTVDGENFTPIERSSNLRNIEITRLLLRTKADVNKTFKERSGDHGAICCAIGRWSRGRTVQSHLPLELVRMLLDAGSKVTVRLIEDCAACLYEDSTNLLIDFHAKTKPLALLHSRIPENVAEKWDNETATRTIIKICKIHADSIEGVAPTFNEYLGPTLDTAAKRGNLDLVQFLLRSCVPSSQVTLLNAIRGKDKDIIRLLVDAGVEFLRSDDYLALAEAIRWGDVEILDLLEHKGAWSWIGAAKENRAAFRSVLQAASDVGQLTIVQKVLDHRPTYTTGLDLNGALESAILANQEAVALMLLDAGADVNEGIPEDRRLVTSSRTLLWALHRKNANIVWSILEADVDIKSEDLLEAVEWGNHSIIEEMISMGVDVNASNEDDECSALVISVEEKDTKSMQLLLNAGANVNSVGQGGRGGLRKTALTAAVTNGDVEMVEHLLSIGADPYDTWALSQALSQGMSMIEKLLTAFNRRYPHGRIGYGGDALIVAIWERDYELFEILLQARIDANTVARELTLEGPAVGKERPEYLDFLTPLGAAIVDEHAGSLAILQRLLSANGNANSIVRSPMCTAKETALLAAVGTKDIQKVQLLIDAGADVNHPAMRGIKRTPLQKAAEIGSFGATQILIDNGALVNAQPAKRGGATALQLAAIGGFFGIAELLLDNGADINAPAAKVDGRTALEGAAEHGRIDMLRLLSNAGAKLHGSEYERALQLAKENGHMATRRYLESFSAEAGGSTLDI